MIPSDGFDRNVSKWLHEDAEHRVPDHLDAVLRRTSTERQRPAWSSLERWLPVQTTLRLTPVPRVAWLLVVLALIVAVGVAALAIGSRPRLPAPFGPARNGAVVYGSTDGDIYAYDPVTGVSTAIITGATGDQTPDFAPNGSTFVFARATDQPQRWLLMLADSDRKNIRQLTNAIDPKFNDWSKDSTRLAVVDASGAVDKLSVYSVDGAAPVDLPVGVDAVDRIQWRSDSELVFLGTKDGTHGLYAIRTDGTAARAILPATGSDTDWIDPVVSPDGTRIAYTKWVPGQTIRIVDIDTSKDVAPVFEGTNEGDGWPTWSPDGTKLVFSRWDGKENHLAVGPATGGAVVEIGPGFPDFTNGAVGEFSPDGAKIIAHYGFDDTATWLLDTTGGSGQRVLTGVDQAVTWQRLAP
jgi:Tol biopolymer transport system component